MSQNNHHLDDMDALPTLEDEHGTIDASIPTNQSLYIPPHNPFPISMTAAITRTRFTSSSSSTDSDEAVFQTKRQKLMDSVTQTISQKNVNQLQSAQISSQNSSNNKQLHQNPLPLKKYNQQQNFRPLHREQDSDLEIVGSLTHSHGHTVTRHSNQPQSNKILSKPSQQSIALDGDDDDFADLVSLVQASSQTSDRTNQLVQSMQQQFNPNASNSTTTTTTSTKSKPKQPTKPVKPTQLSSNHALSHLMMQDLKSHGEIVENAKTIQRQTFGEKIDLNDLISSSLNAHFIPPSTTTSNTTPQSTKHQSIPQSTPLFENPLNLFGDDIAKSMKKAGRTGNNRSSELDDMLLEVSRQSFRSNPATPSTQSPHSSKPSSSSKSQLTNQLLSTDMTDSISPQQQLLQSTTKPTLKPTSSRSSQSHTQITISTPSTSTTQSLQSNNPRKSTTMAPSSVNYPRPPQPPPQPPNLIASESTNIFALYHISPTEATKFMNTDTKAYLQHIRCPLIFPFDPVPIRTSTSPIDPYSNPFTSSTSSGVASFIQTHTTHPTSTSTSTSSAPSSFQTRLAIPPFTGTQNKIFIRGDH